MKLLAIFLVQLPLSYSLSLSLPNWSVDKDKARKALIVMTAMTNQNYRRANFKQVKAPPTRRAIEQAYEKSTKSMKERMMWNLARMYKLKPATIEAEMKKIKTKWDSFNLQQCGYTNILFEHCLEANCCWTSLKDSMGKHPCYKAESDGTCHPGLETDTWLQDPTVPNFMKDIINRKSNYGGRHEVTRQDYDKGHGWLIKMSPERMQWQAKMMGVDDWAKYVEEKYGATIEDMTEESKKMTTYWRTWDLKKCGFGTRSQSVCENMSCCWSDATGKCYSKDIRYGCPKNLSYSHLLSDDPNSEIPDWLQDFSRRMREMKKNGGWGDWKKKAWKTGGWKEKMMKYGGKWGQKTWAW
jgi:hypothetical protein